VEYKKNIKKLALILEGKRKTVLYSLKKEMQQISNTRRISNKQRVQVSQPVRKVVNQTVNSKRQTTAPTGVNKQSNAVVQKTSASPFDALKQ
jgi:excinuclease UvrABC nuclease subunit